MRDIYAFLAKKALRRKPMVQAIWSAGACSRFPKRRQAAALQMGLARLTCGGCGALGGASVGLPSHLPLHIQRLESRQRSEFGVQRWTGRNACPTIENGINWYASLSRLSLSDRQECLSYVYLSGLFLAVKFFRIILPGD